MTIRWPEKVLRPQDVSFDIAPRSLAGPASVAGAAQVVSSDAGIWKATFGSIVITSRQAVLAFRAIDALLDGRLGTILVPLCRAYQPTLVKDLYDAVPHSDSATHDDGSGFVGGTVEVSLTNSVAIRATSANIEIAYGGTIQPGQHFSIGERLYRLRSVTYGTPTTAAITFRPPLRETATAGERLEFDDPVCRMRLASDDEMSLMLSGRRRANPTVNFVEAL